MQSEQHKLNPVLSELTCQIQENKGTVCLDEIKRSLQKKISAIEDLQKSDYATLQESLPRDHSEATSAEDLKRLTKNISKYNQRQLGHLRRKKVLGTLHGIIEQIEGNPDEKTLRSQIESKVIGFSKLQEAEREFELLLFLEVWRFNQEKTSEHNVNATLGKLGFHYASELTEKARVCSWELLKKHAYERNKISGHHVIFELSTRAYVRQSDDHCVVISYEEYSANYKLVYYGPSESHKREFVYLNQNRNQLNTTTLDLKTSEGISLYQGLHEVSKCLAKNAPRIKINVNGEIVSRCSLYELAESISNNHCLPVVSYCGDDGLLNDAVL